VKCSDNGAIDLAFIDLKLHSIRSAIIFTDIMNKMDSRKPSLAPTAVVSPRKVLNICVASISIASLTTSHNSAAAFAPLVPSSTSSAVQKSCSHQTSAFVANSSAKCRSNRIATRGNLHISNSEQRPTSLIPRSAVIQSYRVEDDQNVSTSDAFSFLPSRMSSMQRIESPSDFKSSVLDEENSLVVVRFSADACPSCRATTPLFRRWSRDKDVETGASSSTNRNKLEVKILEMPLNKATSSFIQDNLNVEQLPYCHLYHPKIGLVEEQLVMNKIDFNNFVECVDKWASGDVSPDYDSCILCSKDELIEDCQEWC
jgi:thiol-disulfide isomerase/thioredoxin